MKKTVNLGLLGIARKAGYIEAGEEMVYTSVTSGKAKLVLTASDLGNSSKRKVKSMLRHSNVIWLEIPVTKEELGLAVGRGGTGIVSVTDVGIAASFTEKLTDLGDNYEEAYEKLRDAAERKKQRSKEAAAHKANVKTGKRRTKH